ncbi:MAG TPA: hypothetical protein VEK80_15070 [Kribbellaceae bacterium]|nr:hypothetical protein [Kribbellaceae bacterium]
MTPLERRYRRLMRLLPAQYRAARGEELVSLLLDLDSDRTRPRPAEVLSLVAFALRLRLAAVTVSARTAATFVLTVLQRRLAAVTVSARIPATFVLTALLVAWAPRARVRRSTRTPRRSCGATFPRSAPTGLTTCCPQGCRWPARSPGSSGPGGWR